MLGSMTSPVLFRDVSEKVVKKRISLRASCCLVEEMKRGALHAHTVRYIDADFLQVPKRESRIEPKGEIYVLSKQVRSFILMKEILKMILRDIGGKEMFVSRLRHGCIKKCHIIRCNRGPLYQPTSDPCAPVSAHHVGDAFRMRVVSDKGAILCQGSHCVSWL